MSVIVAFVCGLLSAALTLTGCSLGQSTTSAAPLPDVSQLMNQASTSARDLSSVHMAIDVSGKIPGLPIQHVDGDITRQPSVAARGDADIVLSNNKISAKFVVLNGQLWINLTGTWSSMGDAANLYDPSTVLNPNKGIADVVRSLKNPKAVGRENINGTSTIKVTGESSAETVQGLIPKLPPQTVPTTLWIQDGGQHQLAKIHFDLSGGNSMDVQLTKWNDKFSISSPR